MTLPFYTTLLSCLEAEKSLKTSFDCKSCFKTRYTNVLNLLHTLQRYIILKILVKVANCWTVTLQILFYTRQLADSDSQHTSIMSAKNSFSPYLYLHFAISVLNLCHICDIFVKPLCI